jgi:PAS domain S-box-containing protein
MSTSDPFRHSLRTVLRYAAAVVSVSAALIGTLGLGPVMRTTPTILFFCAVMVSSWFGGLWPGILASLLSTLALDYYFIAPIYTFVIGPKDNLIVFAASALIISWLNGEQKRANADLAQENRDRRKAEVALRASEERWRKLFENSSAGIALGAPDGRFTAANLALQKMLGYTEEELQGFTPLDLTLVEDRIATEARLAEAYEGQRRVYRVEKRYLRKDGRVMWADVSTAFVPASESNSAFFAVVIVDITERKRAEAELHQKEASLREAQTELAHVSRVTTMGELAASIAHEVNQPLAGTVTNANASLRWLAGDSPNLAEAREAIRRIIRDGTRAADVISRMRALFQKVHTAKERLDINEAIAEVVILTQSEVRRNKATLRVEPAADLPPVMGDRVQLQQVVMNLILNGIEAMSTVEDRERDLVIKTQRGEGDEVRVVVQDSGIGFDPLRAERIFDAFHTTKPGGLGMGLSISRSIVESHGGRLWAVSNDGPGATFQFTLLKCQ